jgi:hypothetical protein
MTKPNADSVDPVVAPTSESTAQPDMPQTEEEKRVVQLVKAGLDSGPPIPADDDFFQRLLKRIPSDR